MYDSQYLYRWFEAVPVDTPVDELATRKKWPPAIISRPVPTINSGEHGRPRLVVGFFR